MKRTGNKMTDAAQSSHEIKGKENYEAQEEKKGKLMMQRENVCQV